MILWAIAIMAALLAIMAYACVIAGSRFDRRDDDDC